MTHAVTAQLPLHLTDHAPTEDRTPEHDWRLAHPGSRCGQYPSHAWRLTMQGESVRLVYCQKIASRLFADGWDCLIGKIIYREFDGEWIRSGVAWGVI